MTQQKNPLEMLFQWAQAQPNKNYLFQAGNGKWTPYTYGQVADQVRRMAGALKSMFPTGTKIAISGRNTAHWFMADQAIAMADMVSIGLYPKQSPEHTRFILTHGEAKAVFVGPAPDQAEFIGAIPPGIKTIGFPYGEVPKCDYAWDELVAKHEPAKDAPNKKPDDLLTLIYTSGTTGNPKGVMVTYENMMFCAKGLQETLPPLPSGERFFSYLPLAHAFERGAVELTSLYFGAEVHFLENIDKLAEQLAQVAPTRFFAVPLVYARIQAGVLRKLPQEKLAKLTKIPIFGGYIRRKILKGIGLHNARMCFSGAAPLPVPLMEWFKQYLRLDILQGYGMTENSIYATVNRPDRNRIGSVGQEMPGANMKIDNPDAKGDGEILYKHPGVTPGYYKDPEKTRELFTADGYLRTGDKGRIDQDGYLFITGRVKDIFKGLKGKYVAPAPIEGAMARNTDIDQLCLVGSGMKQPILVVSPTPSARGKDRADFEKSLVADMEAVNQDLEDHEFIAKAIVVRDLWTIDNGIMTPTMKVKRNEVEKRYAAILAANDGTKAKVVWE
ncbi:MAG TPA: AMP-binding protein [Verrucomicrobiae bacterium]|nr:AMP-binding protein [Verrucomicrobiae bacterium]